MSRVSIGEVFTKAVDTTDGVDKFLKLGAASASAINAAISIVQAWGKDVAKLLDHQYEPLKNLVGEVKVANSFIGALAIVVLAKEWLCGDWRLWSSQKIASRACLTPAKAIESALFLNHVGLISLGHIAKGSVQHFASLGRHCFVFPLGIAKDALVIASAGFSIWNSYKEEAGIEGKVQKEQYHARKWEGRTLDAWANAFVSEQRFQSEELLTAFNAEITSFESLKEQEGQDPLSLCEARLNALGELEVDNQVKEALRVYYTRMARAVLKHSFYEKVAERQASLEHICEQHLQALEGSALSEEFKNHLRAFYEKQQAWAQEFNTRATSINDNAHSLEKTLILKMNPDDFAGNLIFLYQRGAKIEGKKTAWRQKVVDLKALYKENIVWSRLYDIAKITICGLGLMASFLMISSTVPCALALLSLGLITAGLDWNRHIMIVQKKIQEGSLKAKPIIA